MTSDVRLVVADVDGTLVTPDKVLTTRARVAVRRIIEAGIAFTVISARPPRGLQPLIDELRIEDPIVAFNGGLVVRPDLSVLREHRIPSGAARSTVDSLTKGGLDVWVYCGRDWYVRSRLAPHVEREERTVGFAPTVVPTFQGVLDRVVKIVGVSDDRTVMARGVAEVLRRLGDQVSAVHSQPYYLDVTHPKANKGEAIDLLSALLGIPSARIAAIGDMPSDVLMFERSGVSIAMGNASPDVQRAAIFVTAANTEEGFARAMEQFVLRASAAPFQDATAAFRNERRDDSDG